MIGKKLSPILVEIENSIIDFEAETPEPAQYTEDGFRAATRVFMSAVLDKLWDLQKSEDMEIETMFAMAEKCGNDLRAFIKTFTGLDSHEFYTVKKE